MRNHYLRNGWILVDGDKELARSWTAAPVVEPATEFDSRHEQPPPEAVARRIDQPVIFGSRRDLPHPSATSASWTGVLYWAALAFCALIFLGAVAQIIDPEGARARKSQNIEVAALQNTEPAIAGKNSAHSSLRKKTPSEQAHYLGTAVEYAGDKCTGEKAASWGSARTSRHFGVWAAPMATTT